MSQKSVDRKYSRLPEQYYFIYSYPQMENNNNELQKLYKFLSIMFRFASSYKYKNNELEIITNN